MPTLIRLIIALLFLAGLGYGAMFALTVFVDPGEKEITVKVPARELVAPPPKRVEPIVRQTPPAPPPVPAASTDPAALQPGAVLPE